MTDLFLEDKLLIHAARVASKFRLDPLTVLRSNALDWILRDAAYRVILDDEHDQAERMKASARKK